MKRDKPHIVYLHMGPWPVYVGFTTSPKAFAREMKRIKQPDVPFLARASADATCHRFDAPDGCLMFVVTMRDPKRRSPEQVAGMLAHEAVHIVQQMWVRLGEDNPGDECEAYLVQYLTQNFMQRALKTGRVSRTSPA